LRLREGPLSLPGRISAALKKFVGRMPFKRQVRMVARVVPARFRFRTALRVSRLHGRLTVMRGGNRVFTEALMLDLWLRELTFSGPYPIPMRVVGGELLKTLGDGRGTLFCWTHLPLIELTLQPLMREGYSPMVLADSGMMVEGNQLLIPGLEQRTGAILNDAGGLLRIRTTLRGGGTVSCLLDPMIAGPISPLILQLACRLGTRIILNWAELTERDEVQVTYMELPSASGDGEASIDELLDYIRMRNHQQLEAMGIVPEQAI
jgi:hypothetical protein